jgi:acyl phosphate:glycerol-3-phosphate acyltransferase
MWMVWLPVVYLVGTFPSAHLVARANGVDITTFGSGNPGASNVTRALGWRKGIWVFVLDAAKGAVAAGVGLAVDGRPAGYLLGAAAVLGHVYPITRGFRGGKGVATGGGVLLVMLPIVGTAVIVLWWLVTRLTGTAAIGSIVAVCAAAAGLALRGAPAWEFAAAVGLSALILVRHVDNVRRLLRRTEPALRSDDARPDPRSGPRTPA